MAPAFFYAPSVDNAKGSSHAPVFASFFEGGDGQRAGNIARSLRAWDRTCCAIPGRCSSLKKFPEYFRCCGRYHAAPSQAADQYKAA